MKMPVWKLLVDRQIFPNRDIATRWVMAGKVIVNDHRVDKPGQQVKSDCRIRVKGLDKKYVSRGGLKLEGALKDFNLSVANKIVLDAGASSGGFTDCLLQSGAKYVYSVDVGYGQLAGSLRLDPRVRNLEKTNISDLSLASLDPKPELATMDLSYLSLKLAIPIIAELLPIDGQMVCLVKPLYEVNDPKMCKTGVIESNIVYKDVLWEIITSVRSAGLSPLHVANSRILGSKGAREFFLLVANTESVLSNREIETVLQAVCG